MTKSHFYRLVFVSEILGFRGPLGLIESLIFSVIPDLGCFDHVLDKLAIKLDFRKCT